VPLCAQQRGTRSTRANDLLVRFARRLANWEEPLSVDELQKREFKGRDGGPDLRPSVYEIEASHEHLVRAYAEHATGIDPPPTGLGLDVTEPHVEVAPSLGNAKFAFIRDRHRELLMRDAAALRTFIAGLLENVAERRLPVTRGEVFAYAHARLQRGDEEWTREANAENAKPWVAKLRPA
jgi:hypothetical protein